MHDKLLRLILENKNVPDTVNALSELTNFSIIIMDTISNVICKNIISGHKNVCKKIFEGNKLFHNIELFLNEPYVNEYGDYKIYMYKLSCKDDIIGYMYVISELLYKSLYTDVIENGKRILELKLEKEKNEPLNAVNLNKVITNIILNSKSLPDKFYLNIRNNYKWNNKKSFIGVCIDIYTKNQKLIEQICGLIGRIFNGQGFFITEDANKIFIFFPMDGDVNLKDIVDKVCIFLNKYDKSVSASFSASRIYDDIKDIPKMYNECYITSLFNKEKETLYYDSLDTIKLLYTLKGNMQTSEYCNKTLGSIKKYDSENKSELVKTLNTYFKFNMNKKVVSKELHIHPETLRYRLSKIEDLTGYSLHNSEGIFALQMGIKLYKMINYNNSSF
ncbi:PucR family transcriptional regulator [Clostridium ljungdahlii]|uniref:Carbohydrate diacid regulator n=2 Tax=Clostridium TaxID=1485 RepID=A0A166SFK4_9CLOT|nr:helix-turn-helix domain-containing protein [Clostridium ljungdahlii]OAA92123.1 Carbohydrate diacid regulator [Clostridium ljungdahlii]